MLGQAWHTVNPTFWVKPHTVNLTFWVKPHSHLAWPGSNLTQPTWPSGSNLTHSQPDFLGQASNTQSLTFWVKPQTHMPNFLDKAWPSGSRGTDAPTAADQTWLQLQRQWSECCQSRCWSVHSAHEKENLIKWFNATVPWSVTGYSMPSQLPVIHCKCNSSYPKQTA